MNTLHNLFLFCGLLLVVWFASLNPRQQSCHKSPAQGWARSAILMLDHDNANANDVRCNHLFIKHAVARIPNRDPRDFSPLAPPADRRSPEARAIHKQAKQVTKRLDFAGRWINLSEQALIIVDRMRLGLSFEAAVLA